MPSYPSINDREFNLLKKIAENTADIAGGGGGGGGGGAPINSPAFTGIPTAPTAAPGTNTTQLATTAFVLANGGGGGGGLAYADDARIIVNRTGDQVVDGALLLADYESAKLLMPNGGGIGSENRAALIIPPGSYDFGATPIDINTVGIDIVGLSGYYKDVIFFSDTPCILSVSQALVKGISFRPDGDDTTPGLLIGSAVNQLEMDYVECQPPGAGFQIQVDDGSGSASGTIINCPINYSMIDGTLSNTAIIDSTEIGNFSPQNAKFKQITGTSTTISSLIVRPTDQTTNSSSITKIATGFATLDFGSIAAGASEDKTISVSGAVFDGVYSIPCIIGFLSAPPPGIVFTAFVSATNTVTLRATNVTALPIDPASTDYSVTIFKITPPS